ncbi:hypothetical protein quinque_000204 [Culex quinquefasciatus]
MSMENNRRVRVPQCQQKLSLIRHLPGDLSCFRFSPRYSSMQVIRLAIRSLYSAPNNCTQIWSGETGCVTCRSQLCSSEFLRCHHLNLLNLHHSDTFRLGRAKDFTTDRSDWRRYLRRSYV